MKFIYIILTVCFAINTIGQNGITFKIEELSRPKNVLPLKSYNDIYERMILEDAKFSEFDTLDTSLKLDYGIIAKSKAPDSLVSFGYNPFLMVCTKPMLTTDLLFYRLI